MINRNFGLLLTGKIISLLGDKAYSIAIAWWIVQETKSPPLMGIFMIVSMLPGILITWFAGAVADRINKRTILIITDIVRGIILITMGYIFAVGSLSVLGVFGIAIMLSVIEAFFEPASQAIIVEIVSDLELARANGFNQTAVGICKVAGPVIGALLVGGVGIEYAFYINGISFILSGIMSCFIFMKNIKREKNIVSITNDIKEGILFLKNNLRMKIVLLVVSMIHFFLGCLIVALPFIAGSIGNKNIKNLGYIETAMGIGLMVGGLILSSNKKIKITEKLMMVVLIIIGISFTAIGGLGYSNIKGIEGYIIIILITGVAVSWASASWITLIQRYTPNEMTGRVFGVMGVAGNVSMPAAFGIMGMIMTVQSIADIMFVLGITLSVVCIIIMSITKRLIMEA